MIVDTRPNVGQGTMEGAVSLDNGVKEFFHCDTSEKNENESDEIPDEKKYGEVVVNPILFQDDIFDPSNSVNAAQLSNDKMERMAESKLLTYNLDKCSYIIVGDIKARKKLL